MKRFALFAALALIGACAGEKSGGNAVSKDPVSVRGWISDVEGSVRAENIEIESARRTQIFQSTQIWVENAQYVSGGVARDGSFILLDVPPGNVTIGFHAPGAESARLVLQNVPGNADILIPAIILKKNGASAVVNPEDIRVRLPATIQEARPTGKTAVVAGAQVPIIEVPIAAMVDRRDYPQPLGFRPVATYK